MKIEVDRPTAERIKPPRRMVTPDQECWVKDRIRDAARMIVAVRNARGVQANEFAETLAIDGICDGAATEIIRTLDLEPCYENLRKPYDHTRSA